MKFAVAVALVVACGNSSGDQSADHSAGQPATATPQPEKKHHHEDRHDVQGSATAFSLDVTVDGAHQTWTPETFAKVAHFTGTNNDGEARDVWSLRSLATGLVGSGARVVSITGDITRTIGSDAWVDQTRVPIVHSTRRGTLKFRWADPDGKWREQDVVKDVTKLEIATK
jgi:hypothetical protein